MANHGALTHTQVRYCYSSRHPVPNSQAFHQDSSGYFAAIPVHYLDYSASADRFARGILSRQSSDAGSEEARAEGHRCFLGGYPAREGGPRAARRMDCRKRHIPEGWLGQPAAGIF